MIPKIFTKSLQNVNFQKIVSSERPNKRFSTKRIYRGRLAPRISSLIVQTI